MTKNPISMICDKDINLPVNLAPVKTDDFETFAEFYNRLYRKIGKD